MRAGHAPVLASQVVTELITDRSGIYLDGTLGGGGHADMILKVLDNNARYIGLDRDQAAIESARARLAHHGDRVILRYADYRHFASVLQDLGIQYINGALYDLGLSSLQLDDPTRGFAYRFEGPLDLRFDPSAGMTAADWLNRATEEEIADALYQFGEERRSRRVARLIVAERESSPSGITSTAQLVGIIRKVAGPRGLEFGRTAARVFQALRIVVNDELAAIPKALEDSVNALADGGRLVVISYHSLEDRIVKEFMREASRECRCAKSLGRCVCGANPRGRLVHRKAVRPSEEEIRQNPRAKAAKMRVFERQSRPGGDR